MNLSEMFKRSWQHLVVLAVFFIITFIYFAPQFEGYELKQHDVEQFRGMAQETIMYREKYGTEPLWTNSMFGGMPTTQISTLYKGNIFQSSIIWFLRTFGGASGIFLLHLLGFYILAMCLRIKPIVGFIGAIAFAFASYEIVILQAGHNSKATTVALMAPVVGAFIMTYRRNWRWGAILSALFMTYQLASNHLQVTYYLAILLFGLGLFEFVMAIRKKELKPFLIATSGLLGAYLLAFIINYGNISLTQDYAKETIRGGNDISLNPDGTLSTINTEGLDKEYITNWSYGVDESFTLLSPYVKGSASVGIADSRFSEMVENSDRTGNEIQSILSAPYPLYWGDQPITSGPVYIGVVLIVIMLLGLVYLKDKRKWVLFAVGLLALMLSWGKNFMGFSEFFIDHVPGYNKFRTVTIILVLIELVVPLIAVLFLQKLIDEKGDIRQNKKPFLITSIAFVVFLIGLRVVGLGDHYSTENERKQIETVPSSVMNQLSEMTDEQLNQNGIDINNPQQIQSIIDNQVERYEEQFSAYKEVRRDIYNSSMNRSILFAILAFGIFALYFYTTLSPFVIIGGLGLFLMFDLIPVSRNYLNDDTDSRGNYKHWIPKEEKAYPLSATSADLQILALESENPKVLRDVQKGTEDGELKAKELGYSGAFRSRLVESYQFAALNFATNYRVFSYDNPWGSSRASYFHKNLGGYHGAKLRNIQNLFEFQIAQSNNKVFDMLNVKYFIQGENVRVNPSAMGNAWLVNEVKIADSPYEEISALGSSFKIKNKGSGTLFINGESLNERVVYGREKLQYVLNQTDTIEIPIANGLSKGMEILVVQDVNGKIGQIPISTLQADTSSSFTQLVSVFVEDEFEPRKKAVLLKSEASKLSSRKYSGNGEITMTSYKPNELIYKAKVEGKGLAVFSEIYYSDGWKAFVDGKEAEILKVNYLLRGLELENGEHEVKFVFDIPKYNTSALLSIIGSIIIFGLLILVFVKEYKKD